MTQLYIVRHGESENNSQKLFQNGASNLSSKGREQAKILAERVANIDNIDLIICSPFTRTRQTLDEVLKLKKHEVVFTELAQELKRPTELIGLAYESPEAIKITDLIDKNKTDPDWHYSDEENFTDFKNRAIKLIEYIESFENKNILLISHGILSKMILSVMLTKDALTPAEFSNINTFFKTENTGITLLRKEEVWNLITWNDHAHLG